MLLYNKNRRKSTAERQIDRAKVHVATTEPEDYARRVVEVVDKRDEYRRDKHLATARRIATPA